MSTIKDNKSIPQMIPLNRSEGMSPSNDLGAVANKKNGEKRDPKMLEAAQSFENQFIRQVIGEMRKTVPKDELVDETMADDIYRDQLDNKYADMWTDQGGVGLTDIIYDQLQSRYGAQHEFPSTPGAFVPLKNQNGSVPASLPLSGVTTFHGKKNTNGEQVHDLLARADRDLFVAKKTPEGFLLKTREPLPETVGLRSPLSGIVLQSAAIEGGKEILVIKHDEGLVTQLVHSGYNRVKTNTRVVAGEVVAELPPSRKGEQANVFFGLRKAAKIE